ncbi:MAG: DUF2585 family protein [Anaerolineales bacterium]|nr:DUF2585 family protein [Anaerolineales bacterium]
MSIERKKLWPILLIAAVLGITALQLHAQGRLWICACGRVDFWSGDIWSSDNSQHIFDPYSFTHLLHGVAFFWLLNWLLKNMPLNWRLLIALVIESVWEVVENAPFIINRYREGALALGYEGDTVVNSISDILLCAVGFLLVHYIGVKRSVIFFVAVELFLILWIRDSLILNIIMLIYPIDALGAWQAGG